jgi:hypothetical protein
MLAAGVYRDRWHKEWRAATLTIAGNGQTKLRYLGSFVNEVNAALVYDQAAREHHGDQTQLNFPDLPPQPQELLFKAPHKRVRLTQGQQGRLTPGATITPHESPAACDL